MKCVDRFTKYRDDELDRILINIRNGNIKSGKYAHLIKIDENTKIKSKELFGDEKSSNSE